MQLRTPQLNVELIMKKVLSLLSLSLGFTILLSVAVAQDSSLPKWIQDYQKEAAPRLMRDYGQLARYRADDAVLKPPAPGEQRVVFIGDSITDNWDLQAYFPGKPYVNRGIGWQNTAQMLLRFRQDVINLHPRVVIILGGTNDLSGAYGSVSLEDIESNYQSMAQLARSNGIEVIFASVPPVHNYTPDALEVYATHPPEKILALNRWLQDYCRAEWVCVSRLPLRSDGRQGPPEEGLFRRRLSPEWGRLSRHGAARRGGDRNGNPTLAKAT